MRFIEDGLRIRATRSCLFSRPLPSAAVSPETVVTANSAP